jgi:putative spermidine/putrescine transport system permease protein
MNSAGLSSILPSGLSGRTIAASGRRRSTRLPPWLMSWFQVGPLAVILIVLFALPTILFLIVSFYDYDRTGIY